MSEDVKNVAPEVEKTRYSDEELAEFRQIINEKLAQARKEYDTLRKVIMHNGSNDIEDTTPSFKTVEDDGAYQLSKEEASQLAQRQYKFIQNLEAALVRIENKTYGVCRVSGKLIPDDRVEAKKDMLDKNPNLRGMYNENDDNTIVLYFEDAVATFSSFTEAPKEIRF